MGIEIEKKYRLTEKQREQVIQSLQNSKAEYCGEEFEENTLFHGEHFEGKNCVLRLRRVGERAILTYKQRFRSNSPIKFQREDETEVSDADATTSIILALGFLPALIYEKKRQTWRMNDVEIVVDELPFGFYMEIEGDEDGIIKTEKILGIENFEAEHETYPTLTRKLGTQNGLVIEARFD
jgi:adenylate cyclase class 2